MSDTALLRVYMVAAATLINASPARSAGWWVTNILYIVQLPPCLCSPLWCWPSVLIGRCWWPALIVLAAFVVDPRSGVWLFKTCDVVAALAAMVYAAQWLLRPDSRLSVAPAAVLLIISFTAVAYSVMMRRYECDSVAHS